MKRLAISLLTLLGICACTQQISSNEEVTIVKFNLPEFIDAEAVNTKTSVIDNGSGFSVVWKESDVLGIYPDTGSQIYFEIQSGAGSNSAVFDGGGWAFKKGAQYVSYYPFIADFYLNREEIPVSFLGQRQSGKSSTSNVGDVFFMCTPYTSADAGTLTFNYQNLCSLIRLNLTLDAGTYTKVSLTTEDPVFVEKGYYSLSDPTHAIHGTEMSNSLTLELDDFSFSQRGQAYAYIVMAPVDLAGKNVTVTITDDKRTDYVCEKTPSRPYEAGSMYGLGCPSWTKVDQSMGVGVGEWETGEDEGGICN